MTPIAKTVGYRIRKLREARDMNQQQVADKLKLTAGAYAKIERGETDPSISRLFEIATILKTDIVNLIKDTPAKVPSDIEAHMLKLSKDVETLKKDMAMLTKNGSKKK